MATEPTFIIMKSFTTLAGFKDLLKIGLIVHSVYHANQIGKGEEGKPIFEDMEPQIREVSIKQTNAFALKTWQASKNKFTDSWLHYPKASECEVKDNKLIIYTIYPYYNNQNERKELRVPMTTYYFPEDVDKLPHP